MLNGNLSLGQLVGFNVYVVMLIWPLRMLGMIIAQGQRSAASAERVRRDPRHRPRDPRQPATVLPLPAEGPSGGRGEVRFEGVRFAYAPELPVVLDGFDLTVPAGQSVALVGATGSGKTTVARLIPRFYDVDAGAVLVDGVDVQDLRLRELRKAVGIVFEDTFLFSDTHRRQHRLRRSRRVDRVDHPRRPPRRRRTSSSRRCPTATTRRSASAASRCRAASASASPSPGRSSPTRGC